MPAIVAEATRETSEALRAAGIRHALIGGVAIAAYGYTRSTKDVDYLMGEEGLIKRGLLVQLRPEVPYQYGDVAIDMLTDEWLSENYAWLPQEGEIPIVPIEVLILTKLNAGRPRDRNDIQGLYGVGAFLPEEIRAYLAKIAPNLIQPFDRLIAEADRG